MKNSMNQEKAEILRERFALFGIVTQFQDRFVSIRTAIKSILFRFPKEIAMTVYLWVTLVFFCIFKETHWCVSISLCKITPWVVQIYCAQQCCILNINNTSQYITRHENPWNIEYKQNTVFATWTLFATWARLKI